MVKRRKSRFLVFALLLMVSTLTVGMQSEAKPRPRQAVDIWLEGPEEDMCGYSEHSFKLNWFEDYTVSENITVRIPKKAAFLVDDVEDIVFESNGTVKSISDLSIKETETEKILTFKADEPIQGSLCSATFMLRTPISTKEMKVIAKVGKDSVPNNPLANYTEHTYGIKQNLTIDTTADVILKDTEFDIFGIAAMNCQPIKDHYRLSMIVYDSKDEGKLVDELSWVIDSKNNTDFGYINGRDYRFTKAKFPNNYLDGKYTIRVSLSTEKGDRKWTLIDFVEKEVLFRKNPPQTPKIIRTPGGESIGTGQNVTINASYVDPEGVPISYEWEGRDHETQKYPTGRNVVQVRAIDEFGLKSPWAADLFFVVNPDGSGGMKLTGPKSTIIEHGLDGYTIGSYTFTVPPVSGHGGQDYGRVRGLNKDGQWVQVNYGTTRNGITLRGSLPKGIYTKLEFYYYTNHTCMYNKSNITYAVKFDYIDGGSGGSTDGSHPVNSINITNAVSSLNEGETLLLNPEVLPVDATNKTISWTSSNPNVASIGSDGKVVALKSGTTTITAMSNSTPSVTKSFRLDVYAPTNKVPVESINVTLGTNVITPNMVIRMLPGEMEQLNAEVLPAEAYDKDLIFASDAPDIVDPNKDGFSGNLGALKNGRAVITVKSEGGNGPSLSFNVYVGIPVDNIMLNKEELTLAVGEEHMLAATVNPAGAFDKTIKWSSENDSIANVDSDGKIKAVSVGTTTILAVSNDNPDLIARCVANVKPVDVTDITASPNKLTIEVGQSMQITAQVTPDNATDSSLVYESLDKDIAEVTQEGLVTAVGVGTTKVKISSVSNDDVVAYVDITVEPPFVAVTDIVVTPDKLKMIEGETKQLTVTVMPGDVSDASVSYESLDTEIVEVTQDGIISAVGVGTTRIKVSSVSNDEVIAYVDVTVYIAVTKIDVTDKEIIMSEGSSNQILAKITPDNATDASLIYESVDPYIASVTPNGLITAESVGFTRIKVSSVSNPDILVYVYIDVRASATE